MTDTIEKSKRTIVHSRLAAILSWIGPSSAFEFHVDRSIDGCAALLKGQERQGLLGKLFSTATTVDITWEDADTYRFCIRKTRGRDTPILATGSLMALMDEATLVRGRVTDDNWGSILAFMGIVAFFVLTQLPGAPVFLGLFVAVALLNFYASATERHRFIDYITEMMQNFDMKRKR